MDLIIGGAYQGKLSYAVKNYRLIDDDICDLSSGYVADKRCYFHLEANSDISLDLLLGADVIISREVGSGVVPIDASQRLWREKHGTLLQELAKQADHVYRIFCGLEEQLK